MKFVKGDRDELGCPRQGHEPVHGVDDADDGAAVRREELQVIFIDEARIGLRRPLIACGTNEVEMGVVCLSAWCGVPCPQTDFIATGRVTRACEACSRCHSTLRRTLIHRPRAGN